MNDINDLMKPLNLGEVISEPIPVSGGLLHKMYRVNTIQDVFAVKVLNPEIMKRPEALQNTVLSEQIAAVLCEYVPVVAAMDFEGEQVLEWQEKYYMIFPWLEGASVFAPHITKHHCEAIGDLLGKMHASNVTVEGVEPEMDTEGMHAWEEYVRLAEARNVQQLEWYVAYKNALAEIIYRNKEVCEAQPYLAQKQVISHRDLDPKNVIWQGEKPFVIDWEAAGYVNPYQELLEVINYWADDGKGGLQKGHLKVIIQAYKKHMGLKNIDWEPVFAGSFSGMLGWLEYNVKRALRMEVSSEEDIRAGEEQVIGTITEIHHFQQKLNIIKEALMN